jgi:hydroxyacylglutathione hydrolase
MLDKLYYEEEVCRMRISEHIYTIRVSFTAQIPGESTLISRFVNLYLVAGRSLNLIDAGVAGGEDNIWTMVEESGRNARDIERIILTHAHPDHIGAAKGLKEILRCKVAASEENVRWIEDVETQYRERPAPSFHTLVQGSVMVDERLRDGETIDLGDGSSLQVLYTPGHSKGHLAFLHEQDGVLMTGDSVPVPGLAPIYEDVAASLHSLEKMESLKGVRVTASSWDDPRYGKEAHQALIDGRRQIVEVHLKVLKAKEELQSSDAMKIARRVFEALGLPQSEFMPSFVKTIDAHLHSGDSIPGMVRE